MARIRTVKPELPQDVKLASTSRDARYTFILLITQADDEGLIPGAHRQLLGLLYPHDEDVSTGMLLGWVEELIGVGAVRWRATVDGAPILELSNWAKHQRVDNKGRSQLSGFLLPLGETPPFADSRREPPRTAATRGIPPLGPRTKDLGPRTGDDGPPPGADAPVVQTVRVAAPSSDVGSVLEHYRGLHPRKRPDEKARKAIVRALKTYTVPELCEAITGNANDQWCKDTGNQGLPYLLRDNATIDKYRDRGKIAAVADIDVVDGWFAA